MIRLIEVIFLFDQLHSSRFMTKELYVEVPVLQPARRGKGGGGVKR